MGWDKTKPVDNDHVKYGPQYIREIKEFLENSLTDEGYEKYFRVCTSATRPNPAPLCMIIAETDSKNVYKCVVGGTDPTWKELGSYTGLTWQGPVKDRDLSEPPAAPAAGDRYIVDQDTYAISYIHQVNKIFAMAGNYAGRFAEGDIFEVLGSTGNNGIYTITDATYNSGESRTELTVSEAIPDDTVDGNILHSQGAWNGHYNDTTEWEGTTWTFTTKSEGMACYCDDEATFVYFNGTSWIKFSEGIGILAQTNVEKDETEAQTWDDPITDLKSNLNRIRHQIKTAVGEAWGTITHSIVDCWAKFHATTGHKHTGGANNAPKLDAANTHESPSANTHHNQSHTLASHSTKPHSALTGVGADQHHNESHNAASHSDIASTGANIDDAVTKKHVQNADTELDSGVVDIDASNNVTINQNAVVPFTSLNSGAVVNTLYLKEGKVGIRTIVPKDKLHVVSGSTNAFAWATVQNDYAEASMDNTGSGIKFKLYNYGSADNIKKWAGIVAVSEANFAHKIGLAFYTRTDQVESDPSEKVRILANGNVGINTDSPDEKLCVVGNVVVGNLAVGTNGTRVLMLTNGTIPSSSPANAVQLYAEDESESSELKARDEAGNIAVLTANVEGYPVDMIVSKDYPYVTLRENVYAGISTYISLNKMAELVQELARKEGLLAQDKYIIKHIAMDISRIENWNNNQNSIKGQKDKKALEKALEEEVEITFAEAIEEVAEMKQIKVSSKTRYKLNLKIGEVEIEKIPVHKDKPTGKMKKQLKAGVRFDEETGKFYRKKIETEVTITPYEIKQPSQWIKEKTK